MSVSWALSLLLRVPAVVGTLIMRVLDSVFHLFIFLGVFVAFAHRVGWVNRLIWRIGEREATKLCNGAPVTAGSFTIDWTRALEGRLRITVNNVVIHSPDRDAWRWDSPLVARIGVAVVDCNLITTLLNLAIRQIEIPVELYSVRLVDIQFFVERRQHIFNFYLLDPALVIPDPKDVMGDISPSTPDLADGKSGALHSKNSAPSSPTTGDFGINGDNESRDDSDDDKRSTVKGGSSPPSPTTPRRSTILSDSEETVVTQVQPDAATEVTLATTTTTTTTVSTTSTTNVDSSPLTSKNGAERSALLPAKRSPPPEQAQAQQLVQDMLQAVKSLGNAASQTGSFQGALQRHSHQWADTLRKVRDPGKVLQHVGKVAAESFQESSNLMSSSSSAAPTRSVPVLLPERRTTGLPPPVYGRVGRILIQSMRIFTRETGDIINNTNNTTVEDTTDAGVGWSKPITIQQVLLRASDLCPPLSLNELAQHGDPSMSAIYQPMDKIAEVLQRRVLTEMAKTNTGRLFRTAMGEFIGFMKLQGTNVQQQQQQQQ